MTRARPTPSFFGCVAMIGLRDAGCGCVARKGVRGGKDETRKAKLEIRRAMGAGWGRLAGWAEKRGVEWEQFEMRLAYTGYSSRNWAACQLQR
jgi:hypothetical protein